MKVKDLMTTDISCVKEDASAYTVAVQMKKENVAIAHMFEMEAARSCVNSPFAMTSKGKCLQALLRFGWQLPSGTGFREGALQNRQEALL